MIWCLKKIMPCTEIDSFLSMLLSKYSWETRQFLECAEREDAVSSKVTTLVEAAALHQFFKKSLPTPPATWGCIERTVYMASVVSEIGLDYGIELYGTPNKKTFFDVPELRGSGCKWHTHMAISINVLFDDREQLMILDPMNSTLITPEEWKKWLVGDASIMRCVEKRFISSLDLFQDRSSRFKEMTNTYSSYHYGDPRHIMAALHTLEDSPESPYVIRRTNEKTNRYL